ncbi:MAG: hypothetical protein AB7J35_07865 [Dehalococcoidia bacterium]
MYSIRVRADVEVLEAVFTASVTTEEALRAVSQAFVLAEAGNISRAICDLREVEDGLPHGSLSVIAASFTSRLSAGQRIAMLCTPEQLPVARRFARFARIGEELGVFTRAADADAWIESAPSTRLSETMLRHMRAILEDADADRDEQPRQRRHTA